MDPLQEQAARNAIMDTKARYCRYLDTKNWDGFGSLFTDDAVLDVKEDTGAEPFQGRGAITETVRNVVQHAKTVHQVHSPEIRFTGPDQADVIWAMQDRLIWKPGTCPIPNASGVTGYGYYYEHYVRGDSTWQIAALKLTRLLLDPQP